MIVGRAPWRNLTMVAYFRPLGFRTLRHVGRADHLHVSLAPSGASRGEHSDLRGLSDTRLEPATP